MKIVQINAVYGISSTGRTSQEMHEYLLKQGIESHVFCRRTNSQSEYVNIIGNILSYRIHGVLSSFFSLQGYGSVFSTLRLVRQLKKITPDIVILRNLHENYINIPILLSYLSSNNINVILVLHDCWFYTGGCTFYSFNGCSNWRDKCGNCLFYKKNRYGKIINLSKFNLSVKKYLFSKIKNLYVVGVSDWSVNEAKQSFLKFYSEGFYRIYNWIDHGKFYPKENNTIRQEFGIQNESFVAVCAAQNWNIKKGGSLLSQIAQLLPEVVFLVIGDYKFPLSNNIICLGTLSDVNKLADVFSAADLFVNLSQEESFGKVSAEALSCGTPVISNRLTANPEIVEWDDYIINEYSADSYVDAIKKHMIRKSSNELMIQKCLNLSQKNFSLNRNMNCYLNIFKSII